MGSVHGIARLGLHKNIFAHSAMDRHRDQYLRHRPGGARQLLVHRPSDATLLALLDYRLAAYRDLRASSEADVLGDIGASLRAPFDVYFLPDPARHPLCIEFGGA